MIAVAYLGALLLVGDTLARRWFTTTATMERLATAFLVGLPVTTWATYLIAAAAGSAEQPLVVADVVVLGIVTPALVLLRLRRRSWRGVRAGVAAARERFPAIARRRWLDWLTIGLAAVLVVWMAVATFGYDGANLLVGLHEIGDFGPNTAISASFALGHNFPTEYPLFVGEPILYHFLFYFQAGNLTYLGWNPALAGNVLFAGSMVSLLVVLLAIGRRVFGSAAVGRLAVVLFFLHGSLSFVPYLASFDSVGAALEAIPGREQFLTSIFPYRAEGWAIWTQNVFLNQRHLASAIGLVLVILLFVLDRAMTRADATTAMTGAAATPTWPQALRRGVRAGLTDRALPGYVVGGLLLGLLPLWNGAIYVCAAVLMAGVFVMLGNRVQMLVMAAVAALVSLPQVLYLRPTDAQSAQYPALHWGFIVEDPAVLNVAAYIVFLFGPKLLLAAVALVSGTGFQRRLFAAIGALFVAAFTVQLSLDVANNHKLLTLWLILANLFVAAGLIRLWRGVPEAAGRFRARVPARAVAVALAVLILVGGLLDLVPIANDTPQRLPMEGDRLYEWVRDETDPGSVFLSDLVIHHAILRAGRKVYFGWPVYALSMGYEMAPREQSYRRLLGSDSPRDVVRELQDAGIDYVAFDDGIRTGSFVTDPNEALYREYLPVVFDDPDHLYRDITIYRVPTDPAAWQGLPGAPPVDMFTGGDGDGAGRMIGPRGIDVAPDGSVLVVDTGNARVQRFAADGTYLDAFGSSGTRAGQLDRPHGVGVDARGHVFVADLADRVQEFDADGSVAGVLEGSDPGFYGPRDVAVDVDTLFILDQGRARVVRRAPDGTFTAFGSFGSGDGQLDDPSGLDAAGGLAVVADPRNQRMVVFSAAGDFVRSIDVPEWGEPFRYPDVAVAPDGATIYASSPSTNEIFVYTVDGERTRVLRDADPGERPLEVPSGLALRPDGTLLVIEFDADRVALVRP